MNNGSLLTTVFCFCPPVVSALLAILLLWTARIWPRKSIDAKLRNLLTVYLATVAANWSLTMIVMYSPQIIVWISGLQYGLFLAVQVFLYHFLYVLTADNDGRPFSPWHYAFPVFMFLLVTVLSIQALPMPSVNERFLIRFILSAVYTVLAVRRIFRYRKKIADYTADTENGSPGWLVFFIALSIPLFITPVIAALSYPHGAASLLWGVLPAVSVFIQIPVLCYHMVTHRYVVMTPAVDETGVAGAPPRKIDRQELERYMASAKPYLKADLHIAGLAAALKTNRSYLSSLINTAYGTNFSQFINERRLSELDALVADPKNSLKSNLELITDAGFGSYHSYYRAKKQQDKRNLLSL